MITSLLLCAALVPLASTSLLADETRLSLSLADAIAQVQPKVVKIYGAGGFRGMEAYQTGLLISAQGHVLTAWSYVLDTEDITVTLNDGRRFQAKLLGADPRLEVAVLKIEATDLSCFDLTQAVEARGGTPVLALSNLFGVATGSEPVSVQRGTVSAKTSLEARRGVFETPYSGPVYVIDVVTNNPGAAGGVLVTRRGELIGMLGKELRNARNNTWLNYALPIDQLRESVKLIREGRFVAHRDEPAKKPERSATLARLGLMLVPDVVERTPPFVDRVLADSPAAAAGLRPDDLIVLVNDRLAPSCKAVRDELARIDYEDQVKLSVLRQQELLEFVLKAAGEEKK
jgi:serine protease Do